MKVICIIIVTVAMFACNDNIQPIADKNMSDMKVPARSAGGDTTDKHDGIDMPGMDSVYYTCSMHPQVMESMPGKLLRAHNQ